MMSFSRALALLALFLGAAAPALALSFPQEERAAPVRLSELARNKTFLPPLAEIPVMPGLEVDEDEKYIHLFGEKILGQVVLSGKVNVDEVYYFMADALPKLGWRRAQPKLYIRQDQTLHLEARSASPSGRTVVRLALE